MSVRASTMRPAGLSASVLSAAVAIEVGRRAAPIIAVGLLNMTISLTDVAMMARFDPRAWADAALVSDAYSIAFYFASGVLGATIPLAATAIGAGDRPVVGRIIAEALIVLAVLAVVGHALVDGAVGLLEHTGIAFSDPQTAQSYARCLALSFGPMLLFVLCRNILAADGRGRAPMLILVAAVPVNAAGDYAFMYGAFGAPALGLIGAGVATVLVAILTSGAAIAYLVCGTYTRSFGVTTAFRRIRFTGLANLARLGTLIGIATVSETGAFMASTLVVGAIAPEAAPSHILALRAFGVGYCIITGLAQALTALVARRIGAGEEGVEARSAGIAATLGAVLAGVFLAASCPPALALLDTSGTPNAAAIGPLVGVVLVAVTFNAMALSLLRAQRITAVPAATVFVAFWIIAPLVVFAVEGQSGGATAIWVGLAVGGSTSAAAGWIWIVARLSRSTRGAENRFSTCHPKLPPMALSEAAT